MGTVLIQTSTEQYWKPSLGFPVKQEPLGFSFLLSASAFVTSALTQDLIGCNAEKTPRSFTCSIGVMCQSPVLERSTKLVSPSVAKSVPRLGIWGISRLLDMTGFDLCKITVGVHCWCICKEGWNGKLQVSYHFQLNHFPKTWLWVYQNRLMLLFSCRSWMSVGGPCNSWLRNVASSWAVHMKYRGSTGEGRLW